MSAALARSCPALPSLAHPLPEGARRGTEAGRWPRGYRVLEPQPIGELRPDSRNPGTLPRTGFHSGRRMVFGTKAWT